MGGRTSYEAQMWEHPGALCERCLEHRLENINEKHIIIWNPMSDEIFDSTKVTVSCNAKKRMPYDIAIKYPTFETQLVLVMQLLVG